MTNITCTVCPIGCKMVIENDIVSGNTCKRGEVYARNELTNPVRVITTTVGVINGVNKRVPIKTSDAVNKYANYDIMDIVKNLTVEAPIKCGDVVYKNILDTGADLIATRDIDSVKE